jgi:integrase
VCIAAGAGLRWGECVGLGWDAVDLRARDVYLTRVIVETSGRCELRNYPKLRAGIRRVPLPTFAVEALQRHPQLYTHSAALVFSTSPGGALRRSTFRRRVRVPALDRAGLASTTLNRYVHAPRDYDDRVRGLLDDAC